MRKQRPKTKISSTELKGLKALIFCFILSFFLGCATGGGEGPFFFSSENSRRGAVEGGEPIPEDLPYDSEEQLREEELRRQAEEEAARIAMEERLAEEQRIAEDAQRRAEMEAAQRAAAEEARRKQEEEAKLAAEKQRQAAAEAEKQRQAAEQARLAEEKRRAEEEAARLAEEEARRKQEEEAAAAMAETPPEEEQEEILDEETSTVEPVGDEITPPPVPQEPLTPDFVLTGFKDQEIKVILEGEGWIMANPGPTISFLRKEYSPTGQSIFYLKASENGEYTLFYSRSAAVGIEKRVVLLKIVPEHGTEETTAEVIQEPQQPAAGAPAAPPAPAETPSAPAVVRQPDESAGVQSPDQQKTPAQPGIQGQQQQTVPEVPSVPRVPSVPAPEAPRATEQIQPPAVVRDLASPPALPKEPSDNVDVPPAPTPSQTELGTLEEKELKDTFDALRNNPADQNTAIKVGETFLQRFGKSNLAAEILYYLGQIYETQGPNVDRQKAYDYYSRAYNDYPISPYSRKSKERMNYLEQFYLRLP